MKRMRPENSSWRDMWTSVRISSCPGSSAGCALPAKRNRIWRAIGQDAPQVVQVVEEQRGALVGREAPAETDGEHVRVAWIGVLEQPVEVRLAAVVARMHARHPVANHVEEPRLDVLAHAPEDVIGDAADLLPDAGVAETVHPAYAEEAVEHLAHSGARKVATCTPFVT